jgi:hypothetical protein
MSAKVLRTYLLCLAHVASCADDLPATLLVELGELEADAARASCDQDRFLVHCFSLATGWLVWLPVLKS